MLDEMLERLAKRRAACCQLPENWFFSYVGPRGAADRRLVEDLKKTLQNSKASTNKAHLLFTCLRGSVLEAGAGFVAQPC